MQEKADKKYADLPHILVVDDDDRIRQLVSRFLCDKGYVVNTASSAEDAREALKRCVYDALIVDIMMPGEDGREFTRKLRRETDLPVLLLTALGEMEDKLDGFASGADDYLPKPFEPRELVARLEAILRRRPKGRKVDGAFAMGPWRYNPTANELVSDNDAVRLTDVEANLLEALAGFDGEPVSREVLSDLCGVDHNTRAIDVQVTRLRRKLEKDPRQPKYLFTVRGKGYRLVTDDI